MFKSDYVRTSAKHIEQTWDYFLKGGPTKVSQMALITHSCGTILFYRKPQLVIFNVEGFPQDHDSFALDHKMHSNKVHITLVGSNYNVIVYHVKFLQQL